MCGIAGVLYSDPDRLISIDILKNMGHAISHRGPDAEGVLVDPGIGLVHRRLSIIDVDGGDQPIGNEDGSVQIIFNGEIYNYQELQSRLQKRGHTFRTKSDTEVLVHLYEEYGDQLVDHLRGMFAFALWDRRNRRLLLARDRLGIKPLYLYRDGNQLIFGSELKAILAHPNVPTEICPRALEDYLSFGIVPGKRSIYSNIEKLPPGHILPVTSGNLRQKSSCYWRLTFEPDYGPSPEQWQERIREKLHETVRLHLVSDVPVGAFLSGGLDSSIVVATGFGLVRDPLQTFSMGFQEEKFSELPFARQVAEQFGTVHTEEIVTADAVSLLDELTHYYDEPFADPSAIPTFLVSRIASRNVKVVLSGDGGDETFGGYSRYAHDMKEAAVRQCLPTWFRQQVLGPLAAVWPKADWLPRPLRAKTLLTNLSLDANAAYANTLAICRQPVRRQLLSPDVQATLNGHDPAIAIRNGYGPDFMNDPLHGMISADVGTILPDDFLVKVDRASMAHGLEVRPPLLDHELMELAARIPSQWKVRRGQTKWILKNAYRSTLSSSLVDRRKQGFDMPIDTWLRGPLREQFEDTVLHSQAPISSYINQQMTRKLFQSHLAGTGSHGNILWAMLVLSSWCDRYLNTCPIGAMV